MSKRLSPEEKQKRKDARFVANSRKGGNKYRVSKGKRGSVHNHYGLFGPVTELVNDIFGNKRKRKK